MSLSISNRFLEPQPTPAERLDVARRRVRFALGEVASDSPPTFETLDEIAQALVLALREMDALQITVAVMQLKGRMVSR
jgi:hypothetical protein